MTNATAYEKVATLITFMLREVKPDVFMASYGTDEVRFYTNEPNEPKLLQVIHWDKQSLGTTLAQLEEVTNTI